MEQEVREKTWNPRREENSMEKRWRKIIWKNKVAKKKVRELLLLRERNFLKIDKLRFNPLRGWWDHPGNN